MRRGGYAIFAEPWNQRSMLLPIRDGDGKEGRMRRPAGVMIAAVMLGLMTAFGLLGCVFAALGMFLGAAMPQMAGVRVAMTASELLMLAWFLFCGWTVVGLVRMQKWARYAAMAIGGCVALFSGIASVGLYLVRDNVPPPATPSPVPMNLIFAGIAGFYGLLALLGGWWLVYFNLRGVRAAFAGEAASEPAPAMIPDGRMAAATGHELGPVAVPVSPLAERGAGTPGWRIVIVAWAWLMLVSVLYFPVVLMLHMPVFLFGTTLRGGAAAVFTLVLLPVQIYLGVGLLKKWKAAWYVAVLWEIYSIALFGSFLLPGVWGRLGAYENELTAQWTLTGPAETMTLNMKPFMVMGTVVGLAIVLVLGTALIRRREDYLRA